METNPSLRILTKTTFGYNARTGNITLSHDEVKAIENNQYDAIRIWAPNYTKLKAQIIDPGKHLDLIKPAPKSLDYFLLSYRGFEVK